jgi:glycosyltransferase 2 family protein
VAIGIALVKLLLLSLAVAAAASPRLGGRLVGGNGWSRFVAAVHLGLDRFRRHPVDALLVLAAGFAYQLVVILSVYLATRALDLDLGPTAVLAFIPAVSIVQVVPVSVGGLGVREGALALFLTPLGIATGQALALGFVVYGLNLAASLLGAPAFAIGGRSAAPVAGGPIGRSDDPSVASAGDRAAGISVR